MRVLIPAVLCAMLAAAPALAEPCPAAPDHRAELDALIARANAATSEAEGRSIGNEMWQYWTDAPDARAQALLDRGIAARAAFDLDTAQAAFDALVAYCPDYAEGYNQRAFVQFIRGNYGEALVDLERALARAPRHVAALAGQGLTLLALGRNRAAQGVLREALKLNPWIPERAYLTAPPDPPAQEL